MVLENFTQQNMLLSKLVDYLNYKMDSRRTPVTIHLDLSKAFDCLSHSILLYKLRFYGINEMAYNLMKNYLENRKQFVQFDSCSSKMKSIDKGVPRTGFNYGALVVSDLHK